MIINFQQAIEFRRHLILTRVLQNYKNQSQELLNQFGNSLQIIRQDFWINNIRKWLREKAQEIVLDHKNNAKLNNQQVQFLLVNQKNIIKFATDKWTQKNRQNYLEVLKRKQEQEEEERRKKEALEQKKREDQLSKSRYLEEVEKKKKQKQAAAQKMEKIINKVKSEEKLLKEFSLYWAFRSEFAYNSQNLLYKNISMTLRQLQIHESFNIARPQLEISFYGFRTKYTLDMMKVKQINRKAFHVQPDGNPYYSFSLMALLKEKSRNEYFSWDLQENVAESLNSDDIEGVTIMLSSYLYQDKIRIRLKDTLALHEKSISEYLDYSLYEFFLYDTSYRIVWLPLIYKKKNKMNQDLSVDTVIPLELYIQLNPESIDCYKYLYDLAKENGYIMDPIYVSKIFLPDLNKNTLKVLFQILEENNPQMKNNVQLSEFMVFLASQKKKINYQDIDFLTIRVFLYRQVIENICYLLTRLQYAEHLWVQLKKEYFKEDALNPKNNPIPMLQQNIQNNPPPMLRSMFYGGIAPHQRPALWFSIMNGPVVYNSMKDILIRKYHIFTEQRTNLEEQTWLYANFRKFAQISKIALFKDIEEFLQKDNLLENSFRNVMRTFMLFCKEQQRHLNVTYLPFVLKICQKFLSFSFYHFLEQKQVPLLDEGFKPPSNDDGFTKCLLKDEQLTRNEAVAFILFSTFVDYVLVDYPIFQKSTQTILDNFSYLQEFLQTKFEKDFQIMKANNLNPETVFLNIMRNLFCEVFNSEMLYTIWDILIYEKFQNKKKKKTYVIPSILVVIIERLQNKLVYLFNEQELYEAIKLECNLIQDFNSFIEQIDIVEEQMRDLLEKGREEDHLLDDVLGQNVPNKLSAD